MKLYDAKASFAAGELSPKMYARTDLAQYQNGARELTNFIVLPQGGVINRPGTRCPLTEQGVVYVFRKARLVPFVYSEEDSAALQFSPSPIHIVLYRPGQPATEIPVSTPYTEEQLDKLRWLQSGDVLYLFHPDVPVHKLSRTETGWTLEQVTFEKGPFEDLNTDDTRKIKAENMGPSFSLSANFDMSGMMYNGQLIRMEAEVKAHAEELTVPRTSDTAFGPWVEVSKPVFGAFTYRTSGKWTGTLEVERYRPDIGWEPFKTHKSESGAEENYSFSGTVEEYAYKYRFRYKGNRADIAVSFSFEGGLVNRMFRVTTFFTMGGQVNSMTAVDVDGNTEDVDWTDAWAVGSFGPDYGYPSMGIFHQERLILANTKHSPQTLWMSRPASWHNFETSIPAKDDDAITLTLASKEINEIRGLASRGDLLIFTAGGEWTAKAGSKSDVFTPSSIVVTPSGYRGSANLAPLDVGDVTLFVQRQGTTVRSIGYKLDVDGYSSNDLSIMAEHIFENNPVRAWAYQQTPWSVVWCVLSDGSIAALTIQSEHQVCAWTRHRLGTGKVTDVCCIPGTEQDEVYFTVQWDATGKHDAPYRVEMLRHRTDLGDAATFKDGFDNGPAVVCALETLDWERTINDGTIQGRHKHLNALTLRLLDTWRLKCGVMTENRKTLDELQFPLDTGPGPWSGGNWSGDVRAYPPGGWARTCRVRLEAEWPAPVCVLGIFPEIVIEPEASASNEN